MRLLPSAEESGAPKPTIPFDFGTPDSYRFYLEAGNITNLDKLYLKGSNWLFNDQFKHDTYDDYWQARDLSQHMKNVHCAVLVVGGWYDAEDLEGPYRTFYAISKFNPETPTTLVEGPWVHGGWARSDGSHLGDVQFNAKTGEYFRANIQFPFFEHYLKGKGAAQPKAVVFETGTNVWRRLDTWPPKAADGEDALLPCRRQAELRSADGGEEQGRVCERSESSGAVCGLHHRYRAAALHGGRPALRQLPA